MVNDGENTGKKGRKTPKPKCIYIRNDLHTRLSEKCQDEGRKMGTVVAALVKRWLEGKTIL